MKYLSRILLLALVAAGLPAGCGGSSTPSPAQTPIITPPPAQVTGVTTPKAVSVVTTN